jgi:hypothetical protein
VKRTPPAEFSEPAIRAKLTLPEVESSALDNPRRG